MQHRFNWQIVSAVLVVWALCLMLAPASLAEAGLKRERVVENAETATISGVVYQDWDQDGSWDAEEPMLADAVVQLHDLRGDMVAEIVTESDGAFLFGGLAPGAYILSEKDPLGYSSSDESQMMLSVQAGDWVEAAFGDMLLLGGSVPSPICQADGVLVIERAAR